MLSNFRKRLPEVIKREDLMESMGNSRTAYRRVVDILNQLGSKLSPAPKNSQLKLIQQRIEVGLTSDVHLYLNRKKNNISANLLYIEKLVEKLPDEVNTKTATIDVLSTLALVEAATSSGRWTVDYLNERIRTSYRAKKSPEFSDQMESLRSTTRKLSEGVANYIWAIRLLSAKPDDLVKRCESIEATFVSDSAEDMSKNGVLKNHPTRDYPVNGFTGGIAYAIGSYFASWSAHTYHLIREELEQIELILLATEAEARNDPSPALQKKIVRLNDRINEKRAQLKSME